MVLKWLLSVTQVKRLHSNSSGLLVTRALQVSSVMYGRCLEMGGHWVVTLEGGESVHGCCCDLLGQDSLSWCSYTWEMVLKWQDTQL